MAKYFIGGELDSSEVEIETSLPDSYEFEVELLISTVKETQKSVVFNIGMGGSVTACPVIHQDRVYFGACDKNIYCIALETGREMWRFSTQGPVVVGVTIEDGRIYSGSYDGNLYCLDMKGNLVWKFALGDRTASRPSVHKGMVYIGCRDGNVYAVKKNGHLKWKFSTGGPVGSRIELYGNRLYVASLDHNLYCLDLSGRLLWKFAAGDQVGEPVASGNAIYFGSFDHCVYALSQEGMLLWKYRTNDKIPVGTSLVVHDDVVYFGSRDYNFYAVRNGMLKWRFRTGNMILTRPVVDEGRVYFTSADYNLYVVDIESGREVWRFRSDGPPLYMDKLGDIIVFGSHDCNVYCINTDRKLLWKFHTSLDYPSTIEDTHDVEYTLTVPVYDSQEKRKDGTASSKETGSYGDFRCNYIGDDMRDYIGTEIKDGLPGMAYKAGKKVYRK